MCLDADKTAIRAHRLCKTPVKGSSGKVRNLRRVSFPSSCWIGQIRCGLIRGDREKLVSILHPLELAHGIRAAGLALHHFGRNIDRPDADRFAIGVYHFFVVAVSRLFFFFIAVAPSFELLHGILPAGQLDRFPAARRHQPDLLDIFAVGKKRQKTPARRPAR